MWKFSPLSLHALKIIQQMKDQPGLLQFKKTGLGYLHYTLSAWENEADMKRFSASGAHLAAMKDTRKIASELSTYTFESDQIPDWKTAKQLLKANGKTITLN
ncbi:MAG: DUF3291 domain-containing protein [Saprospiraceae bacterium]